MARTARQILHHHNKAVLSKNYKEIISDYAEDALLITPDGAFKGKRAIRDFLKNNFLKKMPNIKFIKASNNFLLIEEDTLLVRWSAESDIATISNGVDTFIFKDSKIWRQTGCFDIVSKK